MKIAIVGRGMIRAAAARHLAKAGHEVTLIGPPEPAADWSGHAGAFASHYDEGRIARVNDRRAFFVRVSAASVARYAEIAAESGIAFYTEAGSLITGDAGFMATVEAARAGIAVSCERLGHAAMAARFPFFRLPGDYTGDHEPRLAGHVSPRRLVAAQTEAARRHGARLMPVEATGVAPGRVRTDAGDVACDEVIVAAGGWTDALLGGERRLKVLKRTVALHEIGPAEAERLARMPSLVVQSANGTYILPPIRYADGKLWLKLGGDPEAHEVCGRDEIGAWFRSGGDRAVGVFLTDVLMGFMPGLRFESRRIAPCVTSWTDDGVPLIERLEPGLIIAAGGNGSGAKCSDELGRLAAEAATGGPRS